MITESSGVAGSPRTGSVRDVATSRSPYFPDCSSNSSEYYAPRNKAQPRLREKEHDPGSEQQQSTRRRKHIVKSDLPLAQRVVPPILLAALVSIVAAIPLISNRWFYYWDDSAAAFTPGWHTIGERILSGSWPTLIPELWAGGNVTAEAFTGHTIP